MKHIITPISYQLKDENLLNDYIKNGFVSIKNLINIENLKNFQVELEESLQLFLGNNYSYFENINYLDKNDQSKLYEFHLNSSKLFSISTLSNEIYNVVKILNKNLPLKLNSNGYLLGLPRDSRLAYDFHQEGNYMRGAGKIYNIHFPIFHKSTIENGTMSILIDSHKEGLLPFEKKRLSENSYTDLIPQNIDKLVEKYKEGFCELDLGDCLIFNENLIHKSNFNDTNKCRSVGVWRAFGDFDKAVKKLNPEEL